MLETTRSLKIQNFTASHSAVCKAAQTGFSDFLKRNVNNFDCVRMLEDGNGKKVKISMSALRCACREGRLQDAISLVKLEELVINDKERNELLQDAQLAGNADIVALLLIIGIVPISPSVKDLKPQHPSQLPALNKVWRIYQKKGQLGLFFKYYDTVKDNKKLFSMVTPKEVETSLRHISQYIKDHPTEPNLFGKIVNTGLPSNSTFFDSLNYLFKFFNFHHSFDLKSTSLDSLIEQQSGINLDNNEEDPVRDRYFNVVSRVFSINLVILYYDKDKNRTMSEKFYTNKFNKDAFAFLYIAFTGVGFLPIIEDSICKPSINIENLFTMIDNPSYSISAESLRASIESGFDRSTINSMIKFKPSDSEFVMEMTLLYFVCRCGRSDLVKLLLSMEEVKIDGIQEGYDKNTPLHVACWRGHFNVVIILLYRGADTTIRNKKGELPRLFDKSRLPLKTQELLTAIWSAYDRGIDVFRNEYKFNEGEKIEPQLQENMVDSQTPLTASEMGPIGVNQLCALIDKGVPIEVFKNALHKLSKNHINQVSEKFQCTPLYCACRKGNLEYIEALLQMPRIKLTGQQETDSGDGNTPLHVASWYGHIQVVVALLLRGAIPEKKASGSHGYPYSPQEINYSLSNVKRSALRQVFRLASSIHSSQARQELLSLAEYADKGLPTTPKTDRPEPIWFFVAHEEDEPPSQFAVMPYLWYKRKANVNDKVVLMSLPECSHLNMLYMKYQLNPSQPQWKTKVPIPPVVGMVSGTCIWSFEDWTVDFESLNIYTPTAQYLIWNVPRPPTWYYSSDPLSDGPYVPFSYINNKEIKAAVDGGRPALSFTKTGEKSFFSRSSIFCVLNFKTKDCRMTTDSTTTTHKVLTEEEYLQRASWEADAFLPPKLDPGVRWIPLARNDPQFIKVAAAFYLTMPQRERSGKPINQITSISTAHFPQIRENWEERLRSSRSLHEVDPKFLIGIDFTKLLWHGTGGTDPSIIAENGWKINYASNKNLWGRGSYFASDASYSAPYAYQDKLTGHCKMFLAEVIVGLPFQCVENGNIVEPPRGYNSILGWRHGTWVYVLYESHLAYPTYLVEWSKC